MRARCPVLAPRGKKLLQLRNEPAGSTVTYYSGPVLPCKSVILPATDARITWKFPSAASRCARAYIDAGLVSPPTSTVLRVTRGDGGPAETEVVHPDVWAAVQAGVRVPPRNVVAALLRMDSDRRADELAMLRGGGAIQGQVV